jgi:hypothetical protein
MFRFLHILGSGWKSSTPVPASRSVFITSFLILTLLLVGCGSGRQIIYSQCSYNSDCSNPLVCAGGFCRKQCLDDRDCHNGWVCRAATPTVPFRPGFVYPNLSSYNRCVPPCSQNRVDVNGLTVRLLPIQPGTICTTTKETRPAQPPPQ